MLEPNFLPLPFLRPIFRLNPEILSIIFFMNANMYEDQLIWKDFMLRALTVARKTSQVCRLWRNLVLESGALWGRLIDLELLLQLKSDTWRNEVMRRTHTAPLFVRGIVLTPWEQEKAEFNKKAEKFFAKLFNCTNWERMEVLDVTVDNMDWFSQKTLEYLQRPHRHLKIFRFNNLEDPPTARAPVDSIAFAKKATRLVEFDCMQVAINLQSQWFSNLRLLGLSYRKGSHPFTLSDILNTLENIPRLERLNVRWAIKPATDATTVTIQPKVLSRLKKLGVEDDFATCISFLRKVNPPKGCHLALTTNDGTFLDTPEFVWTSRAVLSRYAESFFSANTVAKIMLGIKDKEFIIHKLDPEGGWDFRLECQLSGTCAPALFNLFVESLLPSLLSSRITQLRFDGTEGCRAVGLGTLSHFLASLNSLEILETTAEVISGYLCPLLAKVVDGAKKKQIPAFSPHLRMVSLLSLDFLNGTTTHSLLLFLRFRAQLGYPITLLDLSSCRHPLQPLDCLEEMRGLRVIWHDVGSNVGSKGRKVYLCGSGTPNELKFISQ